MSAIHCVLAGMGDGALSVTLNITASQNGYVLGTSKLAEYVPGRTRVTVNIASGVVIGSNSNSTPGFSVDSSWAPGDEISITNNGLIFGTGGAGGLMGNAGTGGAAPATGGAPGGTALLALRPVRITNLGGIYGGGGGGGGRGQYYYSTGDADAYEPGYNGGGGGGVLPGPGGNRGSSWTYGSPGSTWQGGNGYGDPGGRRGGRGGDPGQPGETPGTDWEGAPSGAGGAAGAAVIGNSNITWTQTGARYGAIS